MNTQAQTFTAADEIELSVLPFCERTKAMSMRRIGIVSDVLYVAYNLWKGCPGEDRSLAAHVRYHQHHLRGQAERNVAVQNYIYARVPNGAGAKIGDMSHHKVEDLAAVVVRDAQADLAKFRKQYKAATS